MDRILLCKKSPIIKNVNYVWHVFILFFVMMFVACAGIGPYVEGQQDAPLPQLDELTLSPRFKEIIPQKVAVLPFENLTDDKAAAGVVRRCFYNFFAAKKYHDVELYRVDTVLRNEGLLDEGAYLKTDAAQMGKLLHADGLVYGKVTAFTRVFLGAVSQVSVELDVKMVSAYTGEVCWRAKHCTYHRAGGMILNPVMIIPAIVRAALNMRDIEILKTSEDLSREILKTLPEPSLAEMIRPPRITFFAHDAKDDWKAAGDDIHVALVGSLGLVGSFDIADMRKGLSLVENEPGTQIFLGHLYENNILNFNELPTDVQYMINTRNLADDIRDNFRKYSKAIANTKDPDELLVYLKCFKRAVPILIDFGNWEILRSITQVIKSVSLNQSVNSDQMHFGLKIKKLNKIEDFSESKLFKSLDVLERPVVFIFKDVADKIISAYENPDSNQRKEIDKIINDLGAFGVDIVGRMLVNSSDREIRKLSYEKMISKGDPARKWAINVLDDTSQQWFIYRNAMMILGKVSDKEGDFSCARKFLEHANPKIREEVLNLSVSLKPHDGETLVLKAFNDEAPKVRWRAMRILPEFAPISESTMIELLNMITLPVHQNAEAADKHIKKTVHIISTINAMTVIPSHRKVEAAILELLKSFSGGKKSLWHKVKRAVGHDHESLLLKAAIPLLGKTGGDQSESFLKKIIPLYPDLSEIIKKALLQKQ